MNQLCNFFLFFSKEIAIIPAFLLGYYFYNRKVFFYSLVLTLFGLIVAAFLKSFFKIPLLPHLGEGWSFPSGHMFTAVTFWGFLALQLRNKIMSTLVITLLIGIGCSLVYCNYHIFIDVLAAVFFSLILITLYRILLNMSSLGNNEATLSFVFFILSGILTYFTHPFKSVFYIPLGALLGLSIGGFLGKTAFFKKTIPFSLEICLCLVGFALIYYLSPLYDNSILPSKFLTYFLLGIWITFGPKLLMALLKPTRKKNG